MPLSNSPASITSPAPIFVPGATAPTDSPKLNRPATGMRQPTDSFSRGAGPDSPGRSRLSEINTQHPNLAKEITEAKSQAQTAAKRATWKGLKWYEKSLVFALPFGGLALAGLMGTLRSRAENAQAKVGQLVALKVERDTLAA
jgi:hypothetical protein